MHVAYLIYDEVGLSLLPSQLLPLARQVKRSGGQFELVGFASWRDLIRPGWVESQRQRWRDPITGDTVRLHLLPKLGTTLDAWQWRFFFANEISPYTVIHARGPVAAHLALSARRTGEKSIPLIFDARGATPQEWELSEGYGKRRYGTWVKRLVDMERNALSRANAAIFVTQELLQLMREQYGAIPVRSSIVPCCFDFEAQGTASTGTLPREFETRLEQFTAKRLVLLYSGSVAAWQRLDAVAKLYAGLKQRLPQAALLVLTPHTDQFTATAQAAKLSSNDYLAIDLPPQNMGTAYRFAHAGLLLRDANVVNRVAFPVKFAEYLANGLPVVLTRAIPTCASLIEREKLGIVLNDLEDGTLKQAAESVATLCQRDDFEALRRRCREVAGRTVAFSAYADRLMSLYQMEQSS